LLALFEEYEQIPLERMGFPEDWSNMPLWQNHG
jgi:hypothetical protein